jgi:hypothetical protein
MPEDSDKCTPLSLQVALRRNATQKVEFGLTKRCKDVSGRIEAVWIIHFALLEKDGDDFTPKISVDININDEAPAKVKKAEETEKAGLSDRQTLFLMGPVCDSADEAIEEPLGEELRALFASFDPGRARAAAEPDPLEVLDRSGETQEDNTRRLKRRVVAVLDMQ